MDEQGSHLLSIREAPFPEKTQEWKILKKMLRKKLARRIAYRQITQLDSWFN